MSPRGLRCFSSPFQFSKRLSAHRSCVNALAWSGNGRWLASGGDDQSVVLWDFHPSSEALSDPLTFHGPHANVLCLAFTASHQTLLSGGVDSVVLQYDLSRLHAGAEGESRSEHNATIRAISTHPFSDHLFMCASEDGTITLNDTRLPSGGGAGTLSFDSEATGVQFHPVTEHLFVTSNNRGRCHLWDIRTAFSTVRDLDRAEARTLITYVTRLSKPGSPYLANPEAASVVFDATGSKLAITMQHYLPTIYSLWDEWPLATCSGATRQQPHPQPSHENAQAISAPLRPNPSYANFCTIKHGSFSPYGLQTDSYYGAGSDDFLGYVWKVPDGLNHRRCHMELGEWGMRPRGDLVGFAKSVMGQRCVPVQLQNPTFCIHGHQSIPNTVLYHPVEPYIATAGVERHVLVHSPFEATPALGSMARTPEQVRMPRLRHSASAENDITSDSEGETIRLFDEILLKEGQVDVFDVRRESDDSDEKEATDSSIDSD